MASCPVFVGRQAELGSLTASRAAAAESATPRVVTVHGEPGIGKSRLVRELTGSADVWSVVAECTEPTQVLPFGVLADAVPSDFDVAVFKTLGSTGSDAARADAKARLHGALGQAVSEALATTMNTTPVLVIEDLHWADEATLEWIPAYVRFSGEGCLIVLTFRPGRDDPAFSDCLAELVRLRVVTDVPLGPLAGDDVSRMLEHLALGDSWSPHEIVDLADGNPLFVEELAGLVRLEGVEDGSSLPRVIGAVHRQRTAELSDGARRLMWAASAIGRDFSVELLTAINSDVVGSVEGSLADLVAAGLVVERAPRWFSFRHALTQAAAYESIDYQERLQIHRRIAEALEDGIAGRPELRAAELLNHWTIVGDLERMAAWADVACDRALMAHSPATAVEHATSVINALVRVRGEGSHGLLRRRGVAFSWLGRFDDARADHEAALRLARAVGTVDEIWRSEVDLGALAIEDDFELAGELFNSALEHARSLGDEWLAETLSWVGFWLMMDGDPTVALGHQAEALELLQRLGDEHAMGELLDFMGWTNYVRSDLGASRDCYRRGVTLNRMLDAPQPLARCLVGYATRGADYFQLESVWCDGDPNAWAREGWEAVDYARSIDWRSGQARALIWLGLHLGALGIYRDALDCARRGLQIAEDDGQARFEATAHILLNALWLDLLELDRACEHGRSALRLAQYIRSPTVAATAVSFLARAETARGDLDAATDALGQAEHVAEGSMPDRLVTAASAELNLASGEPEAALRQVGHLAATAPGAPQRAIPRLLLLRGTAASVLGRGEEARETYAQAAAAARDLRQRPILWRSLIQAGHQSTDVAEELSADECFRAALRVIDELAITLPDDATRRRFKESATVGLPPATVARQLPVVDLTAREREVASLVAQGCTNREIAERLVLSVRTVEKHVANSLAKLHMRSRVELAVWASARRP